MIEIYLVPEFFNPRLNCTVPGAWIAEYPSGATVAICREYEARDAAAARTILEAQ